MCEHSGGWRLILKSTIIATNPIVSFPNLDVLKQGLETLEFLVVQDGFYPTPTAELAHIVLPDAIWGEKESAFDPISREPNYKQCAVKVEYAQGEKQR